MQPSAAGQSLPPTATGQDLVRLLQRENPLPPGSVLVLAVSGGMDSLVMLHLYAALRRHLKLELHVASLDHGMRGAEGAADVAFVRSTAQGLGLPVTTAASAGLRSEADARRARYDFLAATARRVGSGHVATAHHADDQAETVLLNLLRGSGLRGLAAMRRRSPLPGHPDLTLLRPLLDVERSELHAWGCARGLRSRVDAGNADLGRRRNRLRHETLPALRQQFPQVDRSLRRLARAAALDHDFIQRQLADATAGALVRGEQHIRLERATFRRLHPALQRHLILAVLRELDAQEVDSGQVERAVQLALTGVTGKHLPFSGPLQLRLEYGDLVFEHQDATREWHGPLFQGDAPLTLCAPGETRLPGTSWSVVISRASIPDAAMQVLLALPSDASLTLDTRRTGDRFAPPGLCGHTQSLRKWMIGRKVPRELRRQLPLLRVAGLIAAIFTDTQIVPSARFVSGADDRGGWHCALRRNGSPLAESGLQ